MSRDDELGTEGFKLVLKLMEQSSRDLAFTTNSLIDGYRAEAETLRATLDAVRYRMELLLAADYAPSADAVRRALYPTPGLVDYFRSDPPGAS